MITLAMSLWGDKPLYTDGAVRLARVLPRLRRAARIPLTLRVYHDDTVPPPILAQLRALGCELRVAPTAYPWTQERRACWRLLALADCRAVCSVDADMSVGLYLSAPFVRYLTRTAQALRQRRSVCITWLPNWKHHYQRCIPACFTCFAQPAVWPGVQAHLEAFLRRVPRLPARGGNPYKRQRYGHGYGTDEWYLQFGLVPHRGFQVSVLPWDTGARRCRRAA